MKPKRATDRYSPKAYNGALGQLKNAWSGVFQTNDKRGLVSKVLVIIDQLLNSVEINASLSKPHCTCNQFQPTVTPSPIQIVYKLILSRG